MTQQARAASNSLYMIMIAIETSQLHWIVWTNVFSGVLDDVFSFSMKYFVQKRWRHSRYTAVESLEKARENGDQSGSAGVYAVFV